MPSGAVHLYPCEWWPRTPKHPRVIDRVVLGREWAVDSVAYGKPYAFSRAMPILPWIIAAGPFPTEAAAVAYVHAL